MKLILVFIGFCSILACSGKKARQIETASVTEKKIVAVRADSVNEDFLARAVYDTAMFYNNSPAFESEFLLNEKELLFAYEILHNSFTEDEKSLPIPVKEITWNMNEKDFITVFYVERNNEFVPIETIVYDLNTKW